MNNQENTIDKDFYNKIGLLIKDFPQEKQAEIKERFKLIRYFAISKIPECHKKAEFEFKKLEIDNDLIKKKRTQYYDVLFSQPNYQEEKTVQEIKSEADTSKTEKKEKTALYHGPKGEITKDELFNKSLSKLQKELLYNVKLNKKPPLDLLSKTVKRTIIEYYVAPGDTNYLRVEEGVLSEKERFENWCIEYNAPRDIELYMASSHYRFSVDEEFFKTRPDLERLAQEVEAKKNEVSKFPKKDPALTSLLRSINEIDQNTNTAEAKGRRKFLKFRRGFLPSEALAAKTVVFEFYKILFGSRIGIGNNTSIKLEDFLRNFSSFNPQDDEHKNFPSGSFPRRGAIDRINNAFSRGRSAYRNASRLKNLFSGEQAIASRGATMAASTGARGGIIAAIGATWWVWIIILAILIIVFIILALTSQEATKQEMEEENKVSQLSILKTEVKNAITISENAIYNISVSHNGNLSQVLIVDPIPENAEFVSCSNNCVLKTDESGQTFALWLINSDGQKGTLPTATGSFRYADYGFPSPQNPNPLLTTTKYQRMTTLWNQDMSTHAIKASQILGIDPGMILGWPLHEGIYSSFTDNCEDREFNPNTPCMTRDNNWQVGYGVRILEQLSRLGEAINAMHPNKSIQQIGNDVIAASKTRSNNPITNPSSFPNVALSQIIQNKNDPSMRQLLGILVKDDAIGAYMVGRIIKGYMGPSMARSFWAWSKFHPDGYYLPQKVSNSFDAAYQIVALGGNLTNSINVQLTLKPKQNNSYIINQAYAQAIGASSSANLINSVITLDPGHSPVTTSCKATTKGATGEMELNWQVAKKLEAKLTNLGYNVIMTKNSLNDCVSNKQRAEIANNNNSALFFRVHLNTGSDCRYFMLTPQETSLTTKLPTQDSIAKGNQAAQSIVSALNAARLGLTSSNSVFRPDSSAYNAGEDPNCRNPNLLIGSCYSRVPVTLIEMGGIGCGWLNNNANQEKMADALAIGISNFMIEQISN